MKKNKIIIESKVDVNDISFEDGKLFKQVHVVSPRIFYSKTDTLNGKHRNQFIKIFKSVDAVNLVKQLESKLGYTDSNQGEIILVDSSKTKSQIII